MSDPLNEIHADTTGDTSPTVNDLHTATQTGTLAEMSAYAAQWAADYAAGLIALPTIPRGMLWTATDSPEMRRWDAANWLRVIDEDAAGNVGIGILTSEALSKLHVSYNSTTILSDPLAYKGLLLEGDDSVGITVLTPDDKIGSINFGTPTDSDAGYVRFDHSTDTLTLGADGGASKLDISTASGGLMFTPKTAASGSVMVLNDTAGLVFFQAVKAPGNAEGSGLFEFRGSVTVGPWATGPTEDSIHDTFVVNSKSGIGLGDGTIAVNGTTAVVGTNTHFLDLLKPGDYFVVAGSPAEEKYVASVESDTELTLTEAVTATGSGLHYVTSASQAMTGTGTVDGTTTLLGSGTKFITEIAVGDYIEAYYSEESYETHKVTAIASDTSLTVDAAFAETASGVTLHRIDYKYRFVVNSNGNATIYRGTLDMRRNRVIQIGDPVNDYDATNKAWVLDLTVGDLTAPADDFSMNTHKITDLTDGADPSDAAAFGQIASALASYLPLAGGTMVGDIAMSGSKKLTGLAAGSAAGHSVRYEQAMYTSFSISIGSVGAGVPSTGSIRYIAGFPFACTVTSWRVVGDVSGSCVLDIKTGGTSIIGAGNKPTLAGAQRANAAVSSWTDATLDANQELEFVLDSVATLQTIDVVFFVTKT